jgi:hypothetical protein
MPRFIAFHPALFLFILGNRFGAVSLQLGYSLDIADVNYDRSAHLCGYRAATPNDP